MRSRKKAPLDVSFHPDTAYLFENFSKDFPGLMANLESDFTEYMHYFLGDSETIPARFGKDSPYTKPGIIASAGLMHIHICVPPRVGFSSKRLDKRVCLVSEPERDAALVYTQHLYDEERYCILALLYPYAHKLADEKGSLIQYLANLSRQFRES